MDAQDSEEMVSAAGNRSSTSTGRRSTSKKRKTVRKKTKRKTKKRTLKKKASGVKAFGAKTGGKRKRRKRRKIKRKGAKTARTKSTKSSTIKSRIAGKLGISRPLPGHVLPRMRGQRSDPSLDMQRYDSGIASLSILGSRDDLPLFW